MGRGLGGAAKRQRTEGADRGGPSAPPPPPPPPLSSPIRAELLSESSRAALRAAYAAAQPFTHGVLRPLCEEARLRGAFDEMRTHLTGTFKETDLFKVRAAARRAPRCVAVLARARARVAAAAHAWRRCARAPRRAHRCAPATQP
jgi:hypothetical protein